MPVLWDPPPKLLILVWFTWDPKSKQDKVKVTNFKKSPKILILQETLHATHLLKLLGKMYKYEMYEYEIQSNIMQYCTLQGCYHILKSMHNRKHITIPSRIALQTRGSCDLLTKLQARVSISDWRPLGSSVNISYADIICCLTHWGRDKMAAIFQTTFSNGFFLIKCMNFY